MASQGRSSLGGTPLSPERLAESLIIWINTLDVPGLGHTPVDFADGVAIAHALHQITPDIFDAEKLSKIQTDVGDNVRLRTMNIRKVKRAMQDFFDSLPLGGVWNVTFPEEADVAAGDLRALVQMLELLLGCAVHCAQKEQYVTQLMSLEEEVKGNLMGCIQQLVVRRESETASVDTFASVDAFDAGGLTPSQVQQLITEKDDIMQMYQALQKEHDATVTQLDLAQAALEAGGNGARGDATSPGGRESTSGGDVAALQQQLHTARAESLQFKQTLEHERHEHGEEVSELSSAIADLRRQMERSEQRAAAAERMQDEIEELREKEAELVVAEKSLVRYKARIEELQEMQREAADIAKQNTASATRIEILEETERKVLALQQAAAKANSKISGLEQKLLEETKRGDALLFENKEAENEIHELKKMKQQLNTEKKELHAQIIELHETQDSFSSGGTNLRQLISGGGDSADKEKISRLEEEVKLLRASGSGSEALQSTIDDLVARKAELESQNRSQALEVLALKQDLKKAKSQGGTEDVAIEQLAIAERDAKKSKARADQLEADLRATREELLGLKKAQSLAGLDQREMAAKIEADIREEVGKGRQALEQQCSALRAELAKVSSELATAKQNVADLEVKNEKLNETKDEKTERLTSVLEEKDRLHSRISALTDEHNARIAELRAEHSEKLKAQEAKFESSTEELKSRMAGAAQGSSNEEMLRVQLQCTELEKKLMVADREKAEAVASVQEELRTKESHLEQYKMKMREMKGSMSESLNTDVQAQQVLQAQLDEKKREHEVERQRRERLESQHRREQQMMVSAWYDLGLRYQRLSAERGAGAGGSFLAKQRQASMSTPRK